MVAVPAVRPVAPRRLVAGVIVRLGVLAVPVRGQLVSCHLPRIGPSGAGKPGARAQFAAGRYVKARQNIRCENSPSFPYWPVG